MMDFIKDSYESISLFDLIYLIITILSLIKCSKKGFILSVLAASKWLLAYVITLILFPKTKPYFKDLIDSEYVLDIVLGVGILRPSTRSAFNYLSVFSPNYSKR